MMRSHSFQDRIVAVSCFLAIQSATLAFGATPVDVLIKVAVVDTDLSLKSVPKQRFEIVPDAGDEGQTILVTTSFTGECQVHLYPGHYKVRSTGPVQLGLQTFRWDVPFEVSIGRPTVVELSNDNAAVDTLPASDTTRPPSGATEIFQALRDAVVTVESEGGHGTGFLVDERGLLITNDHVISGSRYFTATFDDEHRLPATVVTSDPNEDVAILLINPKAMPSMRVIKLAADTPEQSPVREGDEVFAIGSPLSQQKIITAGIVSKVETGAIISDVMIDHGNSGGPLINSKKEAVGINTFGEGRGVSGTVRIWKALPVLEQARKKLSEVPMPSLDLRPPIPRIQYPASALKQIVVAEEFDLENYHIVTRRFDIYILTPPALCYFDHQDDIKAAQGRQQRRRKVAVADTYDPVADIKGWYQYVGQYKAIVKVVIVPRIKPTFGSAFAAGLLGSSAVMRYRYQGDVDTLRLIQNSKEVQPIRIGRVPVPKRFAGPAGSMEDVAYYGFADYLPETFKPPSVEGAHMVIEIINEAKGGAVTTEELEDELLQRIWKDFAPLRE